MKEETTEVFYYVEVTYTFRIKARNKLEAVEIVDPALLKVNNPQTGDEVVPDFDAY